MSQSLKTAIVVFVLLTYSTAPANFHSDRSYADTDGLSPPISRLYVGKQRSNKCLGFTIHQCVNKLGPYQNSEIVPESGEVLVRFHGKKNLYVGTGEINHSIGPEWREMRVVNGKIIEESIYVQIIEHGYSWDTRPSKQSGDRIYSCETYGKNNTLSCYGLTPIEPIPQLPELPEIVKNYKPQEIFKYFFQLLTLERCSNLSREYEDKTSKVFAKWQNSAPKLIEMLKASPEYLHALNRVKKETIKRSTRYTVKAQKNCDQILTSFKEQLEGPDEKFSSPEKTWTLFIESLKKGNKEVIVQCLTGQARQNLSSFFINSDETKLREMGNSFTGFELSERMGLYREAAVSRSDGRAGLIYFLENAGNWKISSM